MMTDRPIYINIRVEILTETVEVDNFRPAKSLNVNMCFMYYAHK